MKSDATRYLPVRGGSKSIALAPGNGRITSLLLGSETAGDMRLPQAREHGNDAGSMKRAFPPHRSGRIAAASRASCPGFKGGPWFGRPLCGRLDAGRRCGDSRLP
jgi:hypothetical protein